MDEEYQRSKEGGCLLELQEQLPCVPGASQEVIDMFKLLNTFAASDQEDPEEQEKVIAALTAVGYDKGPGEDTVFTVEDPNNRMKVLPIVCKFGASAILKELFDHIGPAEFQLEDKSVKPWWYLTARSMDLSIGEVKEVMTALITKLKDHKVLDEPFIKTTGNEKEYDSFIQQAACARNLPLFDLLVKSGAKVWDENEENKHFIRNFLTRPPSFVQQLVEDAPDGEPVNEVDLTTRYTKEILAAILKNAPGSVIKEEYVEGNKTKESKVVIAEEPLDIMVATGMNPSYLREAVVEQMIRNKTTCNDFMIYKVTDKEGRNFILRALENGLVIPGLKIAADFKCKHGFGPLYYAARSKRLLCVEKVVAAIAQRPEDVINSFMLIAKLEYMSHPDIKDAAVRVAATGKLGRVQNVLQTINVRAFNYVDPNPIGLVKDEAVHDHSPRLVPAVIALANHKMDSLVEFMFGLTQTSHDGAINETRFTLEKGYSEGIVPKDDKPKKAAAEAGDHSPKTPASPGSVYSAMEDGKGAAKKKKKAEESRYSLFNGLHETMGCGIVSVVNHPVMRGIEDKLSGLRIKQTKRDTVSFVIQLALVTLAVINYTQGDPTFAVLLLALNYVFRVVYFNAKHAGFGNGEGLARFIPRVNYEALFKFSTFWQKFEWVLDGFLAVSFCLMLIGESGVWTYFAAVAVFMTYINLFQYMAKYDTFGVLVLIISKMIQNTTIFTGILMLFLIAFSLAFNVLLAGVDGYDSLWDSFTSMFRGMLGDFDYDSVHDYGSVYGKLLYITFTMSIFVMLLNFLVALLASEYETVRVQSQQVMQVTRCSALYDLWSSMDYAARKKHVYKLAKFPKGKATTYIEEEIKVVAPPLDEVQLSIAASNTGKKVQSLRVGDEYKAYLTELEMPEELMTRLREVRQKVKVQADKIASMERNYKRAKDLLRQLASV